MASITTRAAKGTPLTHAEVDANFTNLNTDKAETAAPTFTGQVKVAAGTAAAPSVTITGDLNTGLFSPSADQLSVTTGGTERLRIDAAGQVEAVSLGTAAAPAWSFVSDPNTGIYSPGADQLALSTGGAERMRINSSGRVGIGTGSPASTLNVNGTCRIQQASTFAGINVRNDNDSSVATTTSFFDASNNLGTIDGHLFIEHLTTGGSSAIIATTPAGDRSTDRRVSRLIISSAGTTTLNSAAATAPFIAQINGAEQARIDSSGRLLVGTSSTRAAGGNFGATTNQVLFETVDIASFTAVGNKADPSGPFFVLAKSRAGVIGGSTAVVADDVLGSIVFAGANGTDLSNIAASIEALVDGTPFSGGDTTDLPGRLVFKTTADGAASPTERMRISSNGNVGIGITNPGRTLSVSSSADTSIQTLSTGTGSYVQFTDSANSSYIGTNNGSIVFLNPTIERARIDSSGRLLVGTSSNRPSRIGTNSFNSLLQIESDAEAAQSITRWAADSNSSRLHLQKGRGTGASPTIVAADDNLGDFTFSGYDGANMTNGANIRAQVDGTPGTNDMPARLVFSTTADGASSATEQLRISNGGTVIYNQPAPAAVDTTATLTVANLTAKIITSSTAAAVTMTLPTGTLMDGGFFGLYNNMAFEWSVINTGATNAVTVQGGAGHTVVGSGTVAANNSQRFLSRRTAATTWVTYRLT
jgi:hypothetical protein